MPQSTKLKVNKIIWVDLLKCILYLRLKLVWFKHLNMYLYTRKI